MINVFLYVGKYLGVVGVICTGIGLGDSSFSEPRFLYLVKGRLVFVLFLAHELVTMLLILFVCVRTPPLDPRFVG